MTDETVRLGRDFGWLWAAFATSSAGTWLAFDAFPLIAIKVLDAGPARVSALAAAGLAAGTVLALPLGPWVEGRRKRPVMIAMDLVRCAALLSVPAAYALGVLTFAQLLAVSMVVAAADIAFTAASGACLKALVPRAGLLTASSRFEATTWTTTALGPPLGGLAIGALGPVATVLANAASFLLSALGIRAIRGDEPRPARAASRPRARDLADGWRFIWADPTLRALFLNGVLVNGLIMAVAPPLAVLMLGDLGFAPWQYGLAFALPCLGGLAGARVARPLAARFGRHRVMLATGTVRTLWPVGLALVGPGAAGLALVMGVELALITCMGIFTPLLAAARLERTPQDRVARTMAAWSVTSKASIAAMTALWGVFGAVLGTRAAIALAGVLLIATPLLLPRREAPEPLPEPAPEPSAA
ncbi:MFS transporter [Actinomadura parmotrematis]|uniref:MFS transporter n=1 Tax=Actinomadura parmotrematis TaxID=2864039 RepID=UPI0027E332A3|nr:MFS transporter [Actinomadura parmotrematis]